MRDAISIAISAGEAQRAELIVESEVIKYQEAYAVYAKTTPGLTGLWQVSGRNRTTYAERVAFDIYYVRNWSVWMDVYLLAKTVLVVLSGYGAY